jgi:uncharacterized integral membrane protein
VRIVNSIIGVIVAIFIILFAVSNRAEVEITLWPLPIDVTLGAYAVVLLSVLVGFIAGMVAHWLSSADVRRDRRRLKAQVRDLEQTLGRARIKADDS